MFTKPFPSFKTTSSFTRNLIFMAQFRLAVKSFRRGAAEKNSHYINRHGIQAKQDLVAQGNFNLPSFANEQPHLMWAASDKHERSNGSAGREYVVSLPTELSNEQNIILTHQLAHSLAGKRPCEFVMHRPRGAISGEDHPHAHIFILDRVPDEYDRTAERFFSRSNSKNPATGGAPKLTGGKSPKQMAIQLLQTKAEAASLINKALVEAGVSQKVEHRSNKERGIARSAERRLDPSEVRKLSSEGKQILLKGRQNP